MTTEEKEKVEEWKKVIRLMNRANELGMYIKVFTHKDKSIDRLELVRDDECIAIFYCLDSLSSLLKVYQPAGKKSKTLNYINESYDSFRRVSEHSQYDSFRRC